MFECVNADADAEVKDAPGSVRVTTLSPGSARVRSPAKCQFVKFSLKNVATLGHPHQHSHFTRWNIRTSAYPHSFTTSIQPMQKYEQWMSHCI